MSAVRVRQERRWCGKGKTVFGREALKKGYIDQDGLNRALEEQTRLKTENEKECFLGEVLIELNLMTEKQVLDVLNTLRAAERRKSRVV